MSVVTVSPWKKTIARIRVCMGMARLAATLGTCPRKAVGCVLVDPATYGVFSTGRNGSPRGIKHCTDVGCLLADVDGRKSCQRAVHAEMNALLDAARTGRSVKGAIAISTARPCERCAMALYQAGVVACWYEDEYEGPEGLVEELRLAGWSCQQIPGGVDAF